MEKYGVKAVLEFFDLGFELGKAGKAALADGKINFFDLPVVLPVIPKLQAAVADASLLPKELFDLSDAEVVQVLDYAKPKFQETFSDELLRRKVSACIKAGLYLAEAIHELKPSDTAVPV